MERSKKPGLRAKSAGQGDPYRTRYPLAQSPPTEKVNDIIQTSCAPLFKRNGITIDVMGGQTDIAQTVVDSNADYVFALKDNQGQLYEDVQLLFDGVSTDELRDVEVDLNQTIDGNYGRIEIHTDQASG